MNELHVETGPAGGPIDSRAGFVAAVHTAVGQALHRGARRMVWVDLDFAEWPLDDEALLQPLTQWLRLPQRQLLLLAQDYDAVPRRHARFVAWYRLWSHAVGAFSPASDANVELPCALLADDAMLVHLLEPQRWRGWSVSDLPSLRQWRDRLDALLQHSVPAFPVTTLGL
jgi:hypothetical protein